MQSGESIRVMQPLFHNGEGGSTPTSPLQMRVEPTTFEHARNLNEVWHSRLPRMGTGFIKLQPFPCFAAVFDGRAFAVAIWSNPVARNLPQHEWLELRRLAHAPDVPRNTGSWMLRIMGKLLKRERPYVTTLVSYSDTEVHKGTIYAAAGWRKTTVNQDGNWTRRLRQRPIAQSAAPKQRWEFSLTSNAEFTERRQASGGMPGSAT